MAIKAGIPPFHFWLPQIIENLNLFCLLILLTWQKIIPTFILSLTYTNFLPLLLIMGAIVGAIGGINQNSIKKVIMFSSISHSSWIIISLLMRVKLWLIYFLMYFFINVNIVWFIKIWFIRKISQINHLNNKKLKIIIVINLIMLRSIPPFTRFLLKSMVIFSLIYTYQIMTLIIIIVLLSLITIIFYIKLSFFILFNNHTSTNLIKNYHLGDIFFPPFVTLIVNFLPLVFFFV